MLRSLFRKAADEPETDATLVEKVELGDMKPWNKVDDDPNAITTEANITAKLNNFKPSNEKNYYAVVLLNNNITTSSTKVTVPTLNQNVWRVAESTGFKQNHRQDKRFLHGECREGDQQWGN